MTKCESCGAEINGEAQMLEALKLAYRKHCLDDPEVGSEELGNALLDAICEAIGDEGYQAWVETLKLDD